MEKHYEISYSRLCELLETEQTFYALIRAGVDNWDGYDWALDDIKPIDLSEFDENG